MTGTLKPCRECGAPCSVQVFPNATLWVCIHNKKLEGGCRSDTAYLSAEDWNTRAPDDVAQIVAWLRGDAGKTRDTLRHLHALKTLSFSQREDWETLIASKIGLADAIERGDWKDKDDG